MRLVTDQEVVTKWQSIYSNAASRDIPCDLSIKRTRELLETEMCYYTGIRFVERDPQLGRSFDRVSSNQGYHDDNIVACITRINAAKANLSLKDLDAISSGIRKFYAKKLGIKMVKPKAKESITLELLVNSPKKTTNVSNIPGLAKATI